RAVVAIEHVSPHRPEAFGRVVGGRGAPAAERVAPACPAHGGCGGCALQVLAPAAQLEAKRRRIERAFAALPAPPPVPSPIAAPGALGYRGRGIYVVGAGPRGLTLGAYAPGGHVLVETLGCRVVAPPIDELATRARDVL